jgi:DNA replication protein DnaC
MAKPPEPELGAGLRRLKLRRARELAPELLQTARTQRWRPEELLAVLVREEIEARERSNLARRLKVAGFTGRKPLRAWTRGPPSYPAHVRVPALAGVARVQGTSAWRRPAGTGASHLSKALDRAACEAGHKVRFFSADELTERSTAASPTTPSAG